MSTGRRPTRSDQAPTPAPSSTTVISLERDQQARERALLVHRDAEHVEQVRVDEAQEGDQTDGAEGAEQQRRGIAPARARREMEGTEACWRRVPRPGLSVVHQGFSPATSPQSVPATVSRASGRVSQSSRNKPLAAATAVATIPRRPGPAAHAPVHHQSLGRESAVAGDRGRQGREGRQLPVFPARFTGRPAVTATTSTQALSRTCIPAAPSVRGTPPARTRPTRARCRIAGSRRRVRAGSSAPRSGAPCRRATARRRAAAVRCHCRRRRPPGHRGCRWRSRMACASSS
jgi:hypothetical protein